MASIYIHIPFCKSICSYCDFPKVLYNREAVLPYLESLANEIEDSYEHEKVETLYIGGGTPSSLSEFQLEKLNEIIETFDLAEDCEFTFECNIEDIDEILLNMLRSMGVNRLSIGIESFDESKLKFMNRSITFKDAKTRIELAKQYGFENINVDLIYGVPYEKVKDLKKDLELFLKLPITHISTYSLIIEDHTMCKIREDENIAEEEEIKMYDHIRSKLKSKGLVQYEVSNFAKPGYESKHNLKYWNNQEYYGFGLGAAGYIKGFRYENTKSIDDYILGKWRLNEHLVSHTEMMENEVMLALRKTKGISTQEFFDKYEVNIQDVFPVKPLLKSKELIYEDGHIFINPKYTYVMNEILLKLI
ncbi:MAG TPA: coproporphyrinogen III oxidase [Firmicutes bacterium]|nr:coproporphyrinogen III oxidase [Bacillota bacterium]